MSPVGPRPIVEREIALYERGYTLYQRVLRASPVCGRSRGATLGYDARPPGRILRAQLVDLVFLHILIWDVHLKAVLSRQGAY